jgi:multidrug efflux pump subunit AcrB
VREAGAQPSVVAGHTLQGPGDIGNLLITTRDGRPVYVKDVASIVVGASTADARVWQLAKGGAAVAGGLSERPAVSVALAKRKGANAVAVAEHILERLDTLHGRLIPDDIEVKVTRNTGETALEKANELLFHLGLATVSIVLLITFAIGWREGLVVAVVIPATILLTLFASHLMGYTINRVSLFALIFSIGILVDDAIVIVENISRHWAMKDGKSVAEKAVEAVAEVGNPTIVATLTIVAALLPMLFVSGMMGPYMSPIPINASAAMIFSFFVAVTITPWLLYRMAGRKAAAGGVHDESGGRLAGFYRRVAVPLLSGRRNSQRFLLAVGGATLLVLGLFPLKAVTVKLLPFDNKSEFQVQIDLPEGSSLEETERTLMAAAARLAPLPELTDIQVYAGTAAPFNFNGLVRHSYLRSSPELGELQVNLLPKGDRKRASHDIALDARRRLAGLPVPEGTAIKVVEVPPGPPVMATLLAEVYGPTAEARAAAAGRVKQAFRDVPFVVDIDDSMGYAARRLRLVVDQEALEFHGVEEEAVFDTLRALFSGVSVGYSHRGHGTNPIEIAVKLPRSALSIDERLLSTPVPGAKGVVELGDVVRVVEDRSSPTVYRRDGRFADMVTAELAGAFEAPVYGMLAVEKVLKALPGSPVAVAYHGQPVDESHATLLWDGEWEVTYVTFRDMGAAFGVALLAIYLLVVAQFGSFKVPLVILVPVPLTLIGIVLGHWMFGAPFSATSMIGFIALAGIIVRNSILLVDFVRHLRAAHPEMTLRDALVEAGAIRVKPILLTALAAMIGAGFILADPIFQGLAISLVFGLASSTALTLLTIPAIYVWLRDDGKDFTKGH